MNLVLRPPSSFPMTHRLWGKIQHHAKVHFFSCLCLVPIMSVERPFINKLYLLGFVCLNLGICFAVVGWSDSVFSLGAALCYGGFFTVSKTRLQPIVFGQDF